MIPAFIAGNTPQAPGLLPEDAAGRTMHYLGCNGQTTDLAMKIFKVSFVNHGTVYEIYARSVNQGELYGFVEVADLMFDQSSTLLVDPAEERLKSEFAAVRRTLIPMHAVIRIDEVEKKGCSRIFDAEPTSKVTPFPGPIYTPDKGPDQ